MIFQYVVNVVTSFIIIPEGVVMKFNIPQKKEIYRIVVKIQPELSRKKVVKGKE